MTPADTVELAVHFIKLIGEQLAEIKRIAISEIDAEMLRLKRNVLEEKLARFKQEMLKHFQTDKAAKLQDLNSRGLSNSSMVFSVTQALENSYNSRLLFATTEYNRAIEEIALIERKISKINMTFIQRFQRYFGFKSVKPRL